MPGTMVASPIGTLHVTADGNGRLVSIDIGANGTATDADASHGSVSAVLEPTVSALLRYFEGELGAIDDLEVAPQRGTDFQRSVWEVLRTIPTGETMSYAELAVAVGRPMSFRAVGSANGANPIPIVVPCHRVVNTDGGLGGYAYGLDMKRWLLSHEGALASNALPGID